MTPTHENISHVVKWNASSRSSFGPKSAWGSIETTTIGKTHSTLPTLDMNEHGVNPKVETQNPLKLVLPKGLLTDQQKKRRRQTSSDQDGSTFGGINLIHHPYIQGCQMILQFGIL